MKTLLFKSLKTSLCSLSLASFVIASPQSPVDDSCPAEYLNRASEVPLVICQPLWDQGDIKALLKLGATSKQQIASVNAFIWEAVINGRTQACKNPQNYNQIASLFDQGGSLHDNLKSYLQNNPVLIHQGSVLSHIIDHLKTNTFQTQLLAENESLYHKVWSSPMEGNDPNGLRNKSILQHLASTVPFKILTADNQALSEQDGENISAHLLAVKSERNYLSLEEAMQLAKTETGMTAKSTFITMSDLELRDPGKKQVFESFLAQTPELNLLLDVGQAFVDNEGVLSMSTAALPQNLRHLTITNARQNATKVDNGFLYAAKGLTDINIYGLNEVTSIGNFFLFGTATLESFDASRFSKVSAIGSFFLQGAKKLKSFDISVFPKVTSIGLKPFSGTTLDGEKITGEILANAKP